MGEVEFNQDNKSNIRWTMFAAWIYGVAGVMALSSGVGPGSFIAILLAAACAYVTVMLHKVSKRPYWQIYKYELTGQREPKEKRYITIGNIIAAVAKVSCKHELWLVARVNNDKKGAGVKSNTFFEY